MKKKANPKVIGAFVVGAAILAAIGIIIFGSGKFFAERHQYVLFFPSSVKGLSVGAPVTQKNDFAGSPKAYSGFESRHPWHFKNSVSAKRYRTPFIFRAFEFIQAEE